MNQKKTTYHCVGWTETELSGRTKGINRNNICEPVAIGRGRS